jgi:CDGSH-type Zn-finger protein/uncharacterized Fe-S cluster protein YjdI
MLRDVAPLPAGRAEEVVLRERAREVAAGVATLAAKHPRLGKAREVLERLVAALAPAGSTASLPVPAAHVTTAPSEVAQAASAVEVAAGRNITIVFEGRRCIHARQCVLGLPEVFKANTPGTWLFPDAVAPEEIVEAAHRCPSGAIRYEWNDAARAGEQPPRVNTVHLRENGPLALHADVLPGGDFQGVRMTLCRCGQSKNKPFCDGSHAEAGFAASGEPATRPDEPLAVRNGRLVVTPTRNGPLVVAGNLEICAGTGRTVARVTSARLCRCGHSANKPFCDGSHMRVGFEAAGE